MSFPVKTIGIIGGGVVGRATARCYHEFAEVRVHDMLPERRTHYLHDILSWADLLFICLPEGSVESFFVNLDQVDRSSNFVLRSTVPIGTTRRLRDKYGLQNLCHSPEFLTSRCAVSDAQTPARNIIGVPGAVPELGKGTSMILVEAEQSNVINLYRDTLLTRFPGVQLLLMSSDESEAVKLMTNAFGATVISLWNEFWSLADKLGLDWERVQAGVLSDGRIPHAWSRVPGPDGKMGFGGKCLPKDLKMMVDHIGDITPQFPREICSDGETSVCEAAWRRNHFVDRREQS